MSTTMENKAGKWWWARRDTRWDVYPQDEPLIRLRVEADGPWSKLFHEDGSKTIAGYILVRECGP